MGKQIILDRTVSFIIYLRGLSSLGSRREAASTNVFKDVHLILTSLTIQSPRDTSPYITSGGHLDLMFPIVVQIVLAGNPFYLLCQISNELNMQSYDMLMIFSFQTFCIYIFVFLAAMKLFLDKLSIYLPKRPYSRQKVTLISIAMVILMSSSLF